MTPFAFLIYDTKVFWKLRYGGERTCHGGGGGGDGNKVSCVVFESNQRNRNNIIVSLSCFTNYIQSPKITNCLYNYVFQYECTSNRNDYYEYIDMNVETATT